MEWLCKYKHISFILSFFLLFFSQIFVLLTFFVCHLLHHLRRCRRRRLWCSRGNNERKRARKNEICLFWLSTAEFETSLRCNEIQNENSTFPPLSSVFRFLFHSNRSKSPLLSLIERKICIRIYCFVHFMRSEYIFIIAYAIQQYKMLQVPISENQQLEYISPILNLFEKHSNFRGRKKNWGGVNLMLIHWVRWK